MSLAVGVSVGYLPSAVHYRLTAALSTAGMHEWADSYFTLDMTPSHLAGKARPHGNNEKWKARAPGAVKGRKPLYLRTL